MSQTVDVNAEETDFPAADAGPQLRVGISACLLGEEVRYDGQHKLDRFLVHSLGAYVKWFPVCPEVEIGMGIPREPIRLVGDVDNPRLVATRSDNEYTERMNRWSENKMAVIEKWDLDGYVLKRASPSCGLYRVKVYPEQGGSPNTNGRGLFARVLCDRFPMLPVEEEGRLHDAHLRERFIAQLFSYHRWKQFLKDDPTPGGLVKFHTAHKLTVMGRSPEHYRKLGRLVADAGNLEWDDLLDRYARIFTDAMQTRTKRGRQVNVMQHLLGFLKDHLSAADKEELLSLFDEYRQGLVPLVVPLTLLKHHLRVEDVPEWVDQQVYLHPYPKELMLRNHV